MQPDPGIGGAFCGGGYALIPAPQCAQQQERRAAANPFDRLERKPRHIVIDHGHVKVATCEVPVRLLKRAVDDRLHFPRLQMLHQDRPGIRVRIDNHHALAAQIGVPKIRIRTAARARRARCNREMEGGAFACLALRPHLPAHQFGQMLSNGQAQPRAAEAPGR